MHGDWIFTCHRCGWRAGWPGIQWLTRSVAAQQFKRTDSLAGVIVSAVAVVGILLGPAGVAMASVDAIPEAPAEPTLTQGPVEQTYDLAKVRSEFRHLLNAERSQRRLGNLS